MMFNKYISFILFYFFITTAAKSLEESNISEKVNNGIKLMENEVAHTSKTEKLELKLFYQSRCQGCIDFYLKHFMPLFEKLNQFLDIHLYPYGNSETIEKDGVITFTCLHGPKECYGNKLHACAIDNLQNITKAILYNACLMEVKKDGSDDEAADKCAASMSLDAEPIKNCAKGPRGTELLKHNGVETRKAKAPSVPYTFINGKVKESGEKIMMEVCEEFKEIPPPCL